MNFGVMGFAALGGGVGGALGALIAKAMSKGSSNARSLPIILGVICAVVCRQAGESNAFQDWIHPPTRQELVVRKFLKRLYQDDALAALAKADPAPASEAGRDLAHLGLKRLPGRTSLMARR